MSEIKSAVALSDLHLGNKQSYLYSNDPRYEKNIMALIALLQELGPHDEIILNGDLLELAIAGHNEVYHDVEEFFTLLAETELYKTGLFIPGNHDHHFWQELGEEIHVNEKIRLRQETPGNDNYTRYFVDQRYSNKEQEAAKQIILSYLWPGNGSDHPEIVVKYPHHLAEVDSNNGKTQYYLFTHGHFLEDMFKPVNHLITPHHLEELEAFNNFWLEAFDYHFGHAGRLSDTARELEHSYRKGKKQAKKKILETLNAVCDNLNQSLRLCWWKLLLLKFGLKWMVKRIPIKSKGGLFQAPIDEKLKQEIINYIDRYIVQRYRKEKKQEYSLPVEKNIPTPFTFVFGHTHRPIMDKEDNNNSVEIEGKVYPLANTGGWLRTDGKGNGDNAGVLVIDPGGCRWESLEGKLE